MGKLVWAEAYHKGVPCPWESRVSITLGRPWLQWIQVTGVDIAEQRLAACRTVLRKDGWWDGGVMDVSRVCRSM